MSSKPSLDVVIAIWEEEEMEASRKVTERVIALFKDADLYDPVTPEEVAEEILKLVTLAFCALHFRVDSIGN